MLLDNPEHAAKKELMQQLFPSVKNVEAGTQHPIPRARNNRRISISWMNLGMVSSLIARDEHLLKAQGESRKADGTYPDAKIPVRAMPAHQHVGLQVADYCLWALQRLEMKNEDRFKRKSRKKLSRNRRPDGSRHLAETGSVFLMVSRK